MKEGSNLARIVATLAGVSGAVVLAVSGVLALLWIMDGSGPAGSAQELLSALALAGVGMLLLLASRYAGSRARGARVADRAT